MWKILLPVLILFSGCTKDYEFVKAQCPEIKTVKQLKPIVVEVDIKGDDHGAIFCLYLEDANGTLCGPAALNLFKWLKQSRKNDTYYFNSINDYNSQFTIEDGR